MADNEIKIILPTKSGPFFSRKYTISPDVVLPDPLTDDIACAYVMHYFQSKHQKQFNAFSKDIQNKLWARINVEDSRQLKLMMELVRNNQEKKSLVFKAAETHSRMPNESKYPSSTVTVSLVHAESKNNTSSIYEYYHYKRALIIKKLEQLQEQNTRLSTDKMPDACILLLPADELVKLAEENRKVALAILQNPLFISATDKKLIREKFLRICAKYPHDLELTMLALQQGVEKSGNSNASSLHILNDNKASLQPFFRKLEEKALEADKEVNQANIDFLINSANLKRYKKHHGAYFARLSADELEVIVETLLQPQNSQKSSVFADMLVKNPQSVQKVLEKKGNSDFIKKIMRLKGGQSAAQQAAFATQLVKAKALNYSTRQATHLNIDAFSTLTGYIADIANIAAIREETPSFFKKWCKTVKKALNEFTAYIRDLVNNTKSDNKADNLRISKALALPTLVTGKINLKLNELQKLLKFPSPVVLATIKNDHYWNMLQNDADKKNVAALERLKKNKNSKSEDKNAHIENLLATHPLVFARYFCDYKNDTEDFLAKVILTNKMQAVNQASSKNEAKEISVTEKTIGNVFTKLYGSKVNPLSDETKIDVVIKNELLLPNPKDRVLSNALVNALKNQTVGFLHEVIKDKTLISIIKTDAALLNKTVGETLDERLNLARELTSIPNDKTSDNILFAMLQAIVQNSLGADSNDQYDDAPNLKRMVNETGFVVHLLEQKSEDSFLNYVLSDDKRLAKLLQISSNNSNNNSIMLHDWLTKFLTATPEQLKKLAHSSNCTLQSLFYDSCSENPALLSQCAGFLNISGQKEAQKIVKTLWSNTALQSKLLELGILQSHMPALLDDVLGDVSARIIVAARLYGTHSESKASSPVDAYLKNLLKEDVTQLIQAGNDKPSELLQKYVAQTDVVESLLSTEDFYGKITSGNKNNVLINLWETNKESLKAKLAEKIAETKDVMQLLQDKNQKLQAIGVEVIVKQPDLLQDCSDFLKTHEAREIVKALLVRDQKALQGKLRELNILQSHMPALLDVVLGDVSERLANAKRLYSIPNESKASSLENNALSSEDIYLKSLLQVDVTQLIQAEDKSSELFKSYADQTNIVETLLSTEGFYEQIASNKNVLIKLWETNKDTLKTKLAELIAGEAKHVMQLLQDENTKLQAIGVGVIAKNPGLLKSGNDLDSWLKKDASLAIWKDLFKAGVGDSLADLVDADNISRFAQDADLQGLARLACAKNRKLIPKLIVDTSVSKLSASFAAEIRAFVTEQANASSKILKEPETVSAIMKLLFDMSEAPELVSTVALMKKTHKQNISIIEAVLNACSQNQDDLNKQAEFLWQQGLSNPEIQSKFYHLDEKAVRALVATQHRELTQFIFSSPLYAKADFSKLTKNQQLLLLTYQKSYCEKEDKENGVSTFLQSDDKNLENDVQSQINKLLFENPVICRNLLTASVNLNPYEKIIFEKFLNAPEDVQIKYVEIAELCGLLRTQFILSVSDPKMVSVFNNLTEKLPQKLNNPFFNGFTAASLQEMLENSSGNKDNHGIKLLKILFEVNNPAVTEFKTHLDPNKVFAILKNASREFVQLVFDKNYRDAFKLSTFFAAPGAIEKKEEVSAGQPVAVENASKSQQFTPMQFAELIEKNSNVGALIVSNDNLAVVASHVIKFNKFTLLQLQQLLSRQPNSEEAKKAITVAMRELPDNTIHELLSHPDTRLSNDQIIWLCSPSVANSKAITLENYPHLAARVAVNYDLYTAIGLSSTHVLEHLDETPKQFLEAMKLYKNTNSFDSELLRTPAVAKKLAKIELPKTEKEWLEASGIISNPSLSLPITTALEIKSSLPSPDTRKTIAAHIANMDKNKAEGESLIKNLEQKLNQTAVERSKIDASVLAKVQGMKNETNDEKAKKKKAYDDTRNEMERVIDNKESSIRKPYKVAEQYGKAALDLLEKEANNSQIDSQILVLRKKRRDLCTLAYRYSELESKALTSENLAIEELKKTNTSKSKAPLCLREAILHYEAAILRLKEHYPEKSDPRILELRKKVVKLYVQLGELEPFIEFITEINKDNNIADMNACLNDDAVLNQVTKPFAQKLLDANPIFFVTPKFIKKLAELWQGKHNEFKALSSGLDSEDTMQKLQMANHVCEIEIDKILKLLDEQKELKDDASSLISQLKTALIKFYLQHGKQDDSKLEPASKEVYDLLKRVYPKKSDEALKILFQEVNKEINKLQIQKNEFVNSAEGAINEANNRSYLVKMVLVKKYTQLGVSALAQLKYQLSNVKEIEGKNLLSFALATMENSDQVGKTLELLLQQADYEIYIKPNNIFSFAKIHPLAARAAIQSHHERLTAPQLIELSLIAYALKDEKEVAEYYLANRQAIMNKQVALKNHIKSNHFDIYEAHQKKSSASLEKKPTASVAAPANNEASTASFYVPTAPDMDPPSAEAEPTSSSEIPAAPDFNVPDAPPPDAPSMPEESAASGSVPVPKSAKKGKAGANKSETPNNSSKGGVSEDDLVNQLKKMKKDAGLKKPEAKAEIKGKGRNEVTKNDVVSQFAKIKKDAELKKAKAKAAEDEREKQKQANSGADEKKSAANASSGSANSHKEDKAQPFDWKAFVENHCKRLSENLAEAKFTDTQLRSANYSLNMIVRDFLRVNTIKPTDLREKLEAAYSAKIKAESSSTKLDNQKVAEKFSALQEIIINTLVDGLSTHYAEMSKSSQHADVSISKVVTPDMLQNVIKLRARAKAANAADSKISHLGHQNNASIGNHSPNFKLGGKSGGAGSARYGIFLPTILHALDKQKALDEKTHGIKQKVEAKNSILIQLEAELEKQGLDKVGEKLKQIGAFVDAFNIAYSPYLLMIDFEDALKEVYKRFQVDNFKIPELLIDVLKKYYSQTYASMLNDTAFGIKDSIKTKITSIKLTQTDFEKIYLLIFNFLKQYILKNIIENELKTPKENFEKGYKEDFENAFEKDVKPASIKLLPAEKRLFLTDEAVERLRDIAKEAAEKYYNDLRRKISAYRENSAASQNASLPTLGSQSTMFASPNKPPQEAKTEASTEAASPAAPEATTATSPRSAN